MSTQDLEIQQLTSAHAGELLTLRRAAFAQAAVAQALSGHRNPALLPELADVERELCDPAKIVLGGFLAGRLVASIRIDVEPPSASLALFAVAPDLQHQGLGTRLLEGVPERLPESIGEVRIAPLPGTEEAMPDQGYRTADFSAFALTAAYLRRIGAD